MMKQIATFCLVTVFLQSTAWAGETSPVDNPPDPDASASQNTGPASIEEQTPAPPSKLPSILEDLYAGGSVGPVFFRDNSIGNFEIDYGVGSQITGLAGVRFGKIRVEAEIASQAAEFEPSGSRFDGDFEVFRATASLYLDVVTLDFDWVSGVTPYFGGGAGIAVADIEGFDDDDTGFTAHGEVGLSFPIQRKIDIVPAYRFEWTDFSEFDKDQKAHIVRVGARYNF